MDFFWVISAKKIKKWAFSGVLTLAVIIFYTGKMNILAKSNPHTAIRNVKTDKKQLALTFDISWGEEKTGPILDILEQKKVKNVTFFLSSPWAETHPDMVKRIVDLGYEIGSHGHKHENYSSYSEEQIYEQINKADTILTKLIGKKPTLLRLPNGDFDKRVLKIAYQLGHKVIQWDTDSLDWMNPGVTKIVKRVLTKAHPGDIILMHASDSCKQTHEALPIIIDKLREKGYELVTVSQLISDSEVKIKTID